MNIMSTFKEGRHETWNNRRNMMEVHDYLTSQAVRNRGAAIWKALGLTGQKAYDETLITAEERACSHLDSYQRTAWDHYVDGWRPEEIARIMDMSDGEIDLIIEQTRSLIMGRL
jgi:DNA-directed RNA polymerase specialized sigma24 family protein